MIYLNLLVFIFIIIIAIYNSYLEKKKKIIIDELKKSVELFWNELTKMHKNYIPNSFYEYLQNKYNDLYKKTILYNDTDLNKFSKYYKSLKQNIDYLNKKYIEKELVNNKEYFDTLFEYSLAEDQRKAIITDDDYNLIIAGAGSGKTSTLIGKVNYLIEKKGINPNEIVAISFTNAAVDNFKNKLKNDNVKCTTFHRLRKVILGKSIFCDKGLLETVIRQYLSEEILKDEKRLTQFVELFSLYPQRILSYDENTDEKYYQKQSIKAKYKKYEKINKDKELLFTLDNDKVMSYEELIIANYLFINGINYEYQQSYKYKLENNQLYHPDFYLPDYDIYIEHFGINREGECASSIDNEKYLKEMNLKRETHKKYNTTLIETYSYYHEEGILFAKLKEQLINLNVKFSKPDLKKIHEAIILNEQLNELNNYIELIERFIELFKGHKYDISKLDEFKDKSIKSKSKKNVLLLNLIKNIYCIYEERLKKENKQDFNDMINITIDDIEKFGVPNKISYIIVDEFQDVSYSKVLLLKTLINKTKAKLVVLGDDWQSIYSFSGCDLNYFINFDKYFKNAKLMNINNIYRHSQELVDISKLIIAKNPNQIIKGKKLISKTHCDKPIGIYYYNDNIYETLKLAIKDLKNQGSKEIAIIGRNKSDLDPIESSIRNEKYENKCEYKDLSKYFDDFPVIFRTIHSSKGLEYDGVIIINMRDGLAGFPNKMQDDPILKYVLPNCNSLEEERRLFYVALTRTKTKTCILAPIEKTSIFIPEILETKPNNIIITKYKEPQTNYKTYYKT